MTRPELLAELTLEIDLRRAELAILCRARDILNPHLTVTARPPRTPDEAGAEELLDHQRGNRR